MRVATPIKRKVRARAKAKPSLPIKVKTQGVRAGEQLNESNIFEQMAEQYRETEQLMARRLRQRIDFSHGPIGLAFMADLHIGHPGMDVRRAFDEAQIIAETPGLYQVIVGDLVDNFIVGKLLGLRLFTKIMIPEEWAIVRKYLKVTAPKLLAMVGGNHDYWTTAISGIDYLKDVTAGISPEVIYDQDDARITVGINGVEWPGRIRHKWRGYSIYNATHGIERGFQQDQDFRWGVGAHSHVSGLARSFNAAGAQGWALMCGTYKRDDQFARRVGFPMMNKSTAVALVFDPATGSMTGFDNLHLAAQFLRSF